MGWVHAPSGTSTSRSARMVGASSPATVKAEKHARMSRGRSDGGSIGGAPADSRNAAYAALGWPAPSTIPNGATIPSDQQNQSAWETTSESGPEIREKARRRYSAWMLL